MYYRSCFMDKTQFNFTDQDKGFLFLTLPAVLCNSPILYSYIMRIQLTRIHHVGVVITIKAVSNKMFVPEKLGAVVKKIKMDCSKCFAIQRLLVINNRKPI